MSRRGNGEGTIVQRTDGRWVAAVSLPNGGRKWVYGRTRKDVGERMAALLAQVQRGVAPPSDRFTVADLLEGWLTGSAQHTLRASTFRSYQDIVRLHLTPELGKIRLVKLEPQHIEQLLARKLGERLSPRRVQYIHAVLRRALGRAERWGLVSRNVATLVDVPQVVHPEARSFSTSQIQTLFDAIQGDRLEPLYLVAISTGLRQGELLGLRWEDVDLQQGSVSVRRSLQRVNGKLDFVEPKTARSRRTVLMSETTVDVLRQQWSQQARERRSAGAKWQEYGLVFATMTGRPLDGMNVTHRFQKLLDRAGLPRRRFHDLRHSCATALLAQGVPARVVMEILGHSQIAVTMNTYSHVLPEVQRDAAKRMDDFLVSVTKRRRQAAG